MTDILDYLPERLAGNPLQSMKSDSDIEAIAEAVINASSLRDECDSDSFFKATAKQLLSSCLGYLRDWCSPEQRTDTNGIRPEDDFCLGCYKRFVQGASPSTRTAIALSLLNALPKRKA